MAVDSGQTLDMHQTVTRQLADGGNSSTPEADVVVSALNLTMSSADVAYVLLSNVTSLVSLAGCLLLLLLFVAYKEIRTAGRLMLVFLCCADITVNVSTLLQTATYYQSLSTLDQKSSLCSTSAGLLVYSQVAVALWVLAISCFLLLSTQGCCAKSTNQIILFFSGFCWIIPLVVTLSADLAGVYGYNKTDLLLYRHPASCWISHTVKKPLGWYLLTVEGWVLATFVWVSLVHLGLSWRLCSSKRRRNPPIAVEDAQSHDFEPANDQLRFIPAIYVCTRIWGTGYFFFTRYPDESHLRASDWLLLIKAVGDNSQGLINTLVFCLANKQIRQLVTKHLHACCKCFSGWFRQHKLLGKEKWLKVQSIVRVRARMPKRLRNLDGSDLDLTGISLDLPISEAEFTEDDIIFERG